MGVLARNGFFAGTVILGLIVACSDDGSPGGSPQDAGQGGAAGSAGGGSGGVAGGAAAPDATAGAAGASDAATEDANEDAGLDADTEAPSCGPNVPFFASAQCVACAEGDCCAQKAACGDEPECISLRACGGKPGCSSGPCWLECIKNHPKGYPVASMFHACLSKSCSSSCGGPTDGCGLTWASPSSCQQCMNSNCCSEIYTATQTIEYWQFNHCRIVNCPTDDPACVASCANDHAAGYATLQTIGSCVDSHCATECGA